MVSLGTLVACGSTDTPLGAAFEPLNGDACSVGEPDRNGCVCTGPEPDPTILHPRGRWVCAGQNSVTCSSVYGSGGGRLLVSADMPCEMEWRSCSDGRAYGIQCDGLRCQCDVVGYPGRSWFTPRCGEMVEATTECGWSLKLPDGASIGNGPGQGYVCEFEGEHDSATNCTCVEGQWDCHYAGTCRLSSEWRNQDVDTDRYNNVLAIAPDGTVVHRLTIPHIPPEAILSHTVPGFVGTWQLEWPNIHFRSTHSPEAPECDGTFGTYALTMSEDCNTLDLTLVSDPCPARVAALDGFSGSR